VVQRISKYVHYFIDGIIRKKLFSLSRGRIGGAKRYADYSVWIRHPKNIKFIKEKIDPDVVNVAYVNKLLDDHLANRVDNSKAIIRLLSFSLWWDRYVKGIPI
jgi:hypothetical protein